MQAARGQAKADAIADHLSCERLRVHVIPRDPRTTRRGRALAARRAQSRARPAAIITCILLNEPLRSVGQNGQGDCDPFIQSGSWHLTPNQCRALLPRVCSQLWSVQHHRQRNLHRKGWRGRSQGC